MRPTAILAAIVLTGCVAPTHAPSASIGPTSSPTPTARIVHPGGLCTPTGATGKTTAGTLMRCTLKAGETRARWRRG